MLLDLFITHWTEPWEVGEKGVRMLAMQRGVDWSQVRVTVVHDGTEKFPDSYFDGCPFSVNQVEIQHRGIAGARNWCIDHSEAEWIKWCDFDDMFAGVYSLKSIMDILPKAQHIDLLWYELLWEMDGRIFRRIKRNPVFIHDKVFRRSFITGHGIRFNEELTWCEDSAFLAVVEMEIDHQRIGRIDSDSPIYLYICRQGSLCNRPEIKFKNLQSFFVRHCYVADEFLKRGLIDPYNAMCFRIMADSYYTLCRAPGITEDKSEHEARVWRWYEAHRDAVSACTPENIDMVMAAVNEEDYEGGLITKEQVYEWILKHERRTA